MVSLSQQHRSHINAKRPELCSFNQDFLDTQLVCLPEKPPMLYVLPAVDTNAVLFFGI